MLVSLSPARADDPVTLKAALTPGRVLRYDAEAKLEVGSGEQPAGVDQKLRLRFTVVRAGQDGALVRGAIESAKVRAVGADKDASEFEWKEGDGPGPEEEPPLAHLYRALVSTVFELTLDGNGKVESISNLDKAAAAAGGDGSVMRAMGILLPEAAPRMLQGLFTMDPDGHAHSIGESWSYSQEVPAGVWMTTARTEYTLKSLADGVATITGSTRITPRPPSRAEAATKPRMEITSQSVTINAEWDARQDRLIRRLTDGKVSCKAMLDVKQPIEATTTSTSRVVFTWVEGPKPPAPSPEK